MKIINIKENGLETALKAMHVQVCDSDEKLQKIVADIIKDVKIRADEALLEYGRKFDSPELDNLKVSEYEFDEAYKLVEPKLLDAIKKAKSNIQKFHEKQVRQSWREENEDYIYGQLVKPIESVGFYAPGGLAPYPSTVLMAAVPGIVAGVKRLVMCAPAQKNGKIHPAMLVAAKECGVNEVYKVGGAQAVAAMAYGTATVLKVDKIVGPGNAYVAEAKRQLFGVVGIDQVAGPSEILIIADESANPKYIAADLLSQAEHANDSRCVLVTSSQEIADRTLDEIKKQTFEAARCEYITESLEDNGIIVIAENESECLEVANEFAPEHLEIVTKDPWKTLEGIKNAGAIMLGTYTSVPLCDYAAGPNHTLPTSGTARFSSALSVDDYIKKSSILSYTKNGLKKIADTVIEIATAEGFEAHANTLNIRLNDNDDS